MSHLKIKIVFIKKSRADLIQGMPTTVHSSMCICFTKIQRL